MKIPETGGVFFYGIELFRSEEEAADRLQGIMSRAFEETLQISQKEKVHRPTAAYILGVGRVAKAV